MVFYNILSNHISFYLLSNPNKVFPLKSPLFTIFFEKNNCPFYAPFAKDTPCRFCHLNAINHKKYKLYNYFARKIQLVFFKYKFNKIIKEKCKEWRIKINYINYLRLYYKYYRKWEKIYYINFNMSSSLI